MTCKDCLHYNACKGTYNATIDNAEYFDFDDKHYADIYGCEDFTEAVSWVHIPYKIGDTVWFITGVNDDTIVSGSIEAINLSQSYDAYCTIRNVSISSPFKGGKIYFVRYIDSIYHSEEEAEKALGAKRDDL